ncbi:MAG: YbaB/EbfC family nucleoid-associated protein [Anaerolineales bacterium]
MSERHPGGDPPDLFPRLEAELRAAREELARQSVEVVSGEGEIRIVMSGTQVCEHVSIQVPGVAPDRARRIELLVQEAVNQAIQESQELAARRLRPMQGGDA